MGKKQRPQTGGEEAQAQNVQNRDIIQRLNFLYQASVHLAHASTSTSTTTPDAPSASNRARNASRRRQTLSLHDLSRSYAQTMRAVGARTVTRIDPAVKRSLCKGCASVLLPGTTAHVRVATSRSHEHAVRTQCKACGASRTIPCPPGAAEIGDASDERQAEELPRGSKRHPRKRPCNVPFFERPEHIVFRGHERLIAATPQEDDVIDMDQDAN
ncbi:Rpr2-domain-containing protein [Exidia glandulosa HHB12029]|uniref:Rpr2-domain-containing protein n=1 Tax=Exidia glandulosa HHB12029 TaxID=1314781 RepID=A0A166AMD3_EXIGL|nr:Rpr2-domain-containing protein [Exidia glandulosa HHB12029]